MWKPSKQVESCLRPNIDMDFPIYLDGAHTPLSISKAVEWFLQGFEGATTSSLGKKVLVFYSAPDRNAAELMLRLLVNLPSLNVDEWRSWCPMGFWDLVIISGISVSRESSRKVPTTREMMLELTQKLGLDYHAEYETEHALEKQSQYGESVPSREWLDVLEETWNEVIKLVCRIGVNITNPIQVITIPRIDDVFNKIQEFAGHEQFDRTDLSTSLDAFTKPLPHTLITGSLYLVGDALKWLADNESQ